jgi:hypothetical protein
MNSDTRAAPPGPPPVGPDAGNEEAGETGGGPGGAARVSEFMQKGYTSFLFLNIE